MDQESILPRRILTPSKMALQSIVNSGHGGLGSRVDQETKAPLLTSKSLKNNGEAHGIGENANTGSRVGQETSATKGDNQREGVPHQHT